MGLGLGDMWKLKTMWDKFTRNHPKFPMFVNAVKQKGVPEGTVIGLSVIYSDGEKMETNLKITEEDLELFKELSQMKK